MKVTLMNDFHNTQIVLRVRKGGILSPNQIKRAKRALCPFSDCTCSGAVRTRGPQYAPDGRKMTVAYDYILLDDTDTPIC